MAQKRDDFGILMLGSSLGIGAGDRGQSSLQKDGHGQSYRMRLHLQSANFFEMSPQFRQEFQESGMRRAGHEGSVARGTNVKFHF